MSAPAAPTPFVWGAGGSRLTPDQIARQREIADALLAQGMDMSPVAHPLQGLARVAQAAAGAYRGYRADQAETANGARDGELLAGLFSGMSGGGEPAATGAPVASSPAATPGQASAFSADFNGVISPEVARNAIASIESAGSGDYSALGPVTRTGDRAYGRYQVMGNNVGPWSEAALGRRLTPQEFAADPAAQDAVFDHVFGGYLNEYGPEGAAQAWFGGPGSVGRSGRRDQLGTSVGDYGSRFLAYVGQNQQPAASTAVDAVNAMGATGGGPVGAMPSPNDPVLGAPAALAPFGAGTASPESMVTPVSPYDDGFNRLSNQSTIVNGVDGNRRNQIVGIGAAGQASDNLRAGGGFDPLPASAAPPVEPMAYAPSPAAPAVAQAIMAQSAPPLQSTAGYGYDPANPRAGGGLADLAPAARQQVSVAMGGQGAVESVAAALPPGAVPAAAPQVSPAVSSVAAAMPQGVMGGIDPAILAAVTDPAASPQTRQIAGILLQQQMARMQPAEPIEINGQLVDPRTGQVVGDYRDAPSSEAFRTLTAEETAAMGLPPGAYQVGPDQRVYPIGGEGQTINVNTGEGSAFFNELDKAQAGSFAELIDQGTAARRNLGRIQQLGTLLENIPTGGGAAFQAALGEWGIPTEGLSDIQAAQAIINQIVPEQRQPGSGPMSDADLALFRQSVPRLINTPGGNQTIIATMQGLAEYSAAQGDIAARVANRELTPAQAREALAALPNPLASFQPQSGGGETPPDVDPEDWAAMTAEERALWQ